MLTWKIILINILEFQQELNIDLTSLKGYEL